MHVNCRIFFLRHMDFVEFISIYVIRLFIIFVRSEDWHCYKSKNPKVHCLECYHMIHTLGKWYGRTIRFSPWVTRPGSGVSVRLGYNDSTALPNVDTTALTLWLCISYHNYYIGINCLYISVINIWMVISLNCHFLYPIEDWFRCWFTQRGSI